jgi:hypothetical protein
MFYDKDIVALCCRNTRNKNEKLRVKMNEIK